MALRLPLKRVTQSDKASANQVSRRLEFQVMLTLTKWIAAPAMALGLMFAGDASEAQAQYGCYGYGGGYGYGGIGIRVGSHYPSYRVPANYGSRYSAYRRGNYHDTSHLDYHPTEIRRHGSHFHVQPGHYDIHRTGHWHH
jgi:hypothetical protein